MALLLLVGCAAGPPPVQYVYKRVDGRSVQSDPKLLQQGQMDEAVCVGEAQRANLSSPTIVNNTYYPPAENTGQAMSQFGDALGGFAATMQARENKNAALEQVYIGCMASRGYVRVPR